MIEKTILNYLISRNMTGIEGNVFLEVPENPPKKYVIIEKTGGRDDDGLQSATIALQSISRKSLLEAAELNETLKGLMKEMPATQDVYGVKLNSDYNFTNTASKEYRYQAVFNIFY